MSINFLHKTICVIELEGNVGVFPKPPGVKQGNLDAMLKELNKIMEWPSAKLAQELVADAIGGKKCELDKEVYKGGQLTKKDQEEMAVKAMLIDEYGHEGKVSTGPQAVASYNASLEHREDGAKFNSHVPTNKRIDPSSHIAQRHNMKTAHSRAVDDRLAAGAESNVPKLGNMPTSQAMVFRRPTGSNHSLG